MVILRLILAKYILKEHFAPFLAAFSVITFLFAVQYLVNILDSVLSKGLPAAILLEILILSLAWMLALAIPMACLVASLMAFGRLSADSEITAIKSAGISPLSMMRPVLVVASLIMVLLVLFNNWVLPEANHRAASLLRSISRKKPQAFIKSGQLIKDFPGVQIWVDQIDERSGRLSGIQIFEIARKGPPKVILARHGWMEYQDMGTVLLLHLEHGSNHVMDEKDPDSYFKIHFTKQTFSVKNVDDSFERKESKHRSDREMPIEGMLELVENSQTKYDQILHDQAKALWGDQDNILVVLDADSIVPRVTIDQSKKEWNPLETSIHLFRGLIKQEKSTERKIRSTTNKLVYQQKRIAQYLVEVHKKFSIPVAAVVFILIGAPLGVMARKGGVGTGVIYSIVFFVIYWVFLMGGEKLADKLMVPPSLAMWSPNIIVGAAGIIVTWKMSKDNYTGHRFWHRPMLSWKAWRLKKLKSSLARQRDVSS